MKSVCNNIVDGVVMNIMDEEIKNPVCYEHGSFVFYTLTCRIMQIKSISNISGLNYCVKSKLYQHLLDI